MINARQKIIKLADKSEFGWATVQEYVSDELADDEADTSKIKKAEKRATVKIKTLQEEKRKTSSKVSSTSAPLSFSASRPGGSFGSFVQFLVIFAPKVHTPTIHPEFLICVFDAASEVTGPISVTSGSKP